MKKILIIHHGKGLGGGLIALLGIIEKLKNDYDVTVLCLFDSIAVEYIKEYNVKVIIPNTFFYSKIYSVFEHSEASYKNLYTFCISFKSFFVCVLNAFFFAPIYLRSIVQQFDLIYLNSTFLVDWCYVAKRNCKKVIVHVREPLAKGFFGIRKGIIRFILFKYCDRIIAITKDNAQRINLLNKTVVIYDPVVFNKTRNSKNLILDPKYEYFIYLGGEQRIKGFEQIVKSLKYLNDNIRVLFAGQFSISKKRSLVKKIIKVLIDPYYWRYPKLINMLKNANNVILLGVIDDVFSYIDNSIALISPFSKPHASLPILEAFSLNKPVIVSDIDGMHEFVDLKTGMFFKNGDPKSLANVINLMSQISDKKRSYYSFEANKKLREIYSSSFSILGIVDDLLREI